MKLPSIPKLPAPIQEKLAGGGMTGVVVLFLWHSFTTTTKEMTEQISEFRRAFVAESKELRTEMSSMNQKLAVVVVQIQQHEKNLTDHEQRLRHQERMRRFLFPASPNLTPAPSQK